MTTVRVWTVFYQGSQNALANLDFVFMGMTCKSRYTEFATFHIQHVSRGDNFFQKISHPSSRVGSIKLVL